MASRADRTEAIGKTGMGDGAPCGRDSVAPTRQWTGAEAQNLAA